MRTVALIVGIFVLSVVASRADQTTSKSIADVDRELDVALDSPDALVQETTKAPSPAPSPAASVPPAPPAADKCKDAPSKTTAIVLQVFFTGFGGGFIAMERYDLMGLCMGVFFVLCCCGCGAVAVITAQGKSDEGMQAVSSAINSCTGCIALGMILWSCIQIGNGNIACGGDYAGCIPQ